MKKVLVLEYNTRQFTFEKKDKYPYELVLESQNGGARAIVELSQSEYDTVQRVINAFDTPKKEWGWYAPSFYID